MTISGARLYNKMKRQKKAVTPKTNCFVRQRTSGTVREAKKKVIEAIEEINKDHVKDLNDSDFQDSNHSASYSASKETFVQTSSFRKRVSRHKDKTVEQKGVFSQYPIEDVNFGNLEPGQAYDVAINIEGKHVPIVAPNVKYFEDHPGGFLHHHVYFGCKEASTGVTTVPVAGFYDYYFLPS